MLDTVILRLIPGLNSAVKLRRSIHCVWYSGAIVVVARWLWGWRSGRNGIDFRLIQPAILFHGIGSIVGCWCHDWTDRQTDLNKLKTG